MKRLRPYQIKDEQNIYEAWAEARRVLYVAFMGTGKTVTYANIARYLVTERHERCLVLIHRVEILKQAYRRLLESGIPKRLISVVRGDDARYNEHAPIQLASVDTVLRRDLPGHFDRIFVDEAHHAVSAKFEEILSRYPRAKVLGLTATPERLDGKPLDAAFDVMVQCSASLPDLIAAGYLSSPEIWTRGGFAPDLEGIGKSGGDYAQGELGRRMNTIEIAGRIVEHWKEKAEGRATVVFAVTVEQARGIVDAFTRAGVSAETLVGTTDDETRAAIFARVEAGTTKVVATCDVIGEGWDAPWMRCIVDAAPTLSLTRNLQRWGRVTRPNGTPPIILDHAGNYMRFGFPCAPRDWSLTGREKRPRHGAPPVRVDADGRVIEYVDEALVKAEDAKRQEVCAGWDGPCPKNRKPSKSAFKSYCIRDRKGEPWRCRSCAIRKAQATLTPEQRSEAARKGHAALTPEQRSERARRAQATLTPEQRSEMSRKAMAALTPEQLSERACKAWVTRRANAEASQDHSSARSALP